MTVYHGGAMAIENPDLLHSRKAVDFGPGFYVTPILQQACGWCEKRKRRFGTAVVSMYELEEEYLRGLRVLRFDSYSEEWLDFIVSCRTENDATDWDVVIGGVANDKVFDTLEAFFDGFATKAQTMDKLQFQQPNLQICLRTEASLGTLKFIWSKER